MREWGKSQQRLLHFQGFGHVPVGDLLQHVKSGVSGIARAKHLAAIVMDTDYTAPGVEVVDVTDDTVELHKASARTRETVKYMRGAARVSLLELADMKAED